MRTIKKWGKSPLTNKTLVVCPQCKRRITIDTDRTVDNNGFVSGGKITCENSKCDFNDEIKLIRD